MGKSANIPKDPNSNLQGAKKMIKKFKQALQETGSTWDNPQDYREIPDHHPHQRQTNPTR